MYFHFPTICIFKIKKKPTGDSRRLVRQKLTRQNGKMYQANAASFMPMLGTVYTTGSVCDLHERDGSS